MVSVAVVSYGTCAISFLGLLLVLVLRREWRACWPLGACSLLASGWAALSVWYTSGGSVLAVEAGEAVRTCSWLAFLFAQLLGPGRTLKTVLIPLATAMAAQLLLPAHMAEVIRLLAAVLGMLLVERLYRDTAPVDRWSKKFFCLGVGIMFAYDFYLYSDSLLLRHVSGDIWSSRGTINALCVPLLLIAARRKAAPAPGLKLSRRLLFGSVALLGAAIYLLTMAASAWYLRAVGGSWGRLMQLASLAGAALLFGVALFSGALRAHLRVFVNKHFYHGSYDYREEWMGLTRSLSDAGQALPLQTIQALAALVESSAGTLWLRAREADYVPAAHWNMQRLPTIPAADSAWCRFMAVRQWVIDVAEYRRSAQRYEGVVLPDWLLAQRDIWLLVPLMMQGDLFGIVCLARPRTALVLNWEVIDLLKIAGCQAASYLAYRQSEDRLSIARQFERFNRMNAFVIHDVKNVISQLSLMAVNADRHRDDPAFQADMIETVRHSLSKLEQLLGRLRQQASEPEDKLIPMAELLTGVLTGFCNARPAPRLVLCEDPLLVKAECHRLERVLGHVIQNAIEASPQNGNVRVRLSAEASFAVIEVSDSGAGMSEQFLREKLFKPFESTKHSGMGIGMFECRSYVEELGGALEVRSAPRQGTDFKIRLPLYGALANGYQA